MMEALAAKDYYIASFLLIGIGTYVMIAAGNLVKKVIGMNIFQTGIFLFFIASAYVEGGTPPLLTSETPHVSPVPHVLILTAIVVGVALTAVALGMIVRIYDDYGTLDERTLKEVRSSD
ncbi:MULTISPECIES: cation:proton antiporter subunit C [Halobacterium]|uniref:Mrp-type sodium/proton antiporter system subunitC n=4 Tax=Halobacterium salinarum TaxID=2242 RepID=Q9HRS7_HALSA|nr:MULTISPECIES: cation:proton antiporter subunit C [Halobacterium]AAG19081.1 conserved hypothetical protein [Halobacterium salinarum NRC-1]MBB6089918.1 multicomponent Na+:H+ antiporter subunit C [Halobacterium salinarum]MCF2165646.1 cation:proton antiporter subunit C [Halobacterium salinarum]MCF2168922.1 cation:proton antiporter subunit C [Halobacterium salinarum]MCF2238942.1 cation:proton antiporter subunit C [Halobacterium salinarum]